MKLALFVYTGLLNALTSFGLVLFVLLKKTRTQLDKRFAWFAFFVGYWAIHYFFWLRSTDPNAALFLIRNTMAGAIFIPSAFFHLVCALVGRTKEKRWLIRGNYALSFLFLAVCFTPLYIQKVEPRLVFPFWPVPGVFFHLALAQFMANVIYGHILMWSGIKSTTGNKRNQIKYVFIGTLLGFGGGCTNYFLWYNIPIAPYLNFSVTIYILTLIYAIAKYRLLDINIALTRTTIFVLLYVFIFGIPLAIVMWGRSLLLAWFGGGWWLVPLMLYAVMSATGPFVYLVLQQKAEDQLLREQRRYQQTLLQASRGMTLIKDLKHLLNLTVHMLTRTIGITHASVYLFSEENHLYERRAQRDRTYQPAVEFLPEDSALFSYLSQIQGAVVAEEIRFRGPHDENSPLASVEKEMERLKAAVIVPSFLRDKLLGFLVLGEKKNRQIYTQDDLNTLSTLANQAALAIENCRFIQEFERTQTVLFQAAKMNALGTMASGIGHQINNRFNAISIGLDFSVKVHLSGMRQAFERQSAEEFSKHAAEVEKNLLQLKKHALHGREIVNRLLDFSKISEKFEPVEFSKVVETAMTFWREYQDVKNLERIDFSTEISTSLPLITGNFSTLEEVVLNFLNNALDAILLKEEAWELGKLPRPAAPEKDKIKIRTYPVEKSGRKYVELEVSDTGIGMSAETINKLYIPFFTTKATSIKGTGLGMYLIKKIAEAHQGEIYVASEYGGGTSFRVRFPAP